MAFGTTASVSDLLDELEELDDVLLLPLVLHAATPSSGTVAAASSRRLALFMAKPPSGPRSRPPVNRRGNRRRRLRDLRDDGRTRPPGDMAAPPVIPGDRHPDDHADDDVLRVGVDVQQHRSVADLLDEERADDRARHGPCPPNRLAPPMTA